MRLHRFFVDQELTENSVITIDSADLTHQVLRVFRLGDGDKIILFNGTHFDYECKLDFEKEESTIVSTKTAGDLRLSIVAKHPSAFLPARKVVLCAALVKKDNFEWIAEKATELGVAAIIPVLSERSEKKDLNEKRLRKIVVEASEQCGRGDVPGIEPVHKLDDVVKEILNPKSKTNSKFEIQNTKPQMLAFHTKGELFGKGDLGDDTQPIFVFIGPEGGWTDAEIEMFHKLGVPVRTLGSQILRAETAVVSALSLCMLGK